MAITNEIGWHPSTRAMINVLGRAKEVKDLDLPGLGADLVWRVGGILQP